MEENDNSLEEKTNQELEERQKDSRAYRKFQIGTMIFGVAMFIPAIVAQSYGYDLRTIDSTCEALVTICACAGAVTVIYGAINYAMPKDMQYQKKNKNYHSFNQ